MGSLSDRAFGRERRADHQGASSARYGENALDVIHNVEAKIDELKPGLPEGVEIQPVYNRSELIKRAIATLNEVLIEQVVIVALICVAFLMHVRSALIAIIIGNECTNIIANEKTNWSMKYIECRCKEKTAWSAKFTSGLL